MVNVKLRSMKALFSFEPTPDTFLKIQMGIAPKCITYITLTLVRFQWVLDLQ